MYDVQEKSVRFLLNRTLFCKTSATLTKAVVNTKSLASSFAPRAISCLETKHYGVHHVDSTFSNDVAINIIAVDPGHVDLISAARSHIAYDEPRPVQTTTETKKQRRRRLLAEKMFELTLSYITVATWSRNLMRAWFIRMEFSTDRIYRKSYDVWWMKGLKRSSFSLSNKECQYSKGRLLQRQRLLGLTKTLDMDETYVDLSAYS